MMSNLNLKTEFPTVNREAWRSGVESGPRGTMLETLARHTEDGTLRGPLMSAQDLPAELAPLARTELPLLDGRPWHIAAPVRDPELGHANKQLLEDLNGGASAVRIEIGSHLKDRNAIKRILEGVFTDLVHVQFAPHTDNDRLLGYVQSIKSLQSAEIWLGLDPLKTDPSITNSLPNWRLFGLTPLSVHEAGGTDVQELAVLAASLAEAMKLHCPETICQNLTIDLSADRDSHLTIAKFRSARRLVRRIAEAFGVDGTQIPICAVTSLRMMQTEDAWTNLLRVMSSGFGAIIGGADVVTTRPFTDGLGQATPFAHRIARNMQLMMMEESQLGQVADAAHGCYWHERLTEDLAQAAWTKFQSIEANGGATAYLGSGAYGSDLKAAIEAREDRNEPILGVSLHPSEGVKAPEVRS